MQTNEEIVDSFYNAFKERDHVKMNACYSQDVLFSDPVFGLLQADEVKKMWEMLCRQAKDLSIVHENIKDIGDDYYTCDWKATYTFSKTGRKVINPIKAYMRLRDGKIIEHSDGFSLYKWSRQALGLPGLLLGWFGFFQRGIKKQARKNLQAFIEKSVAPGVH
ncbi:MAG: nuclear transport factor 2 family protein [Ferruginibacter sp.]